jgi:hypothetical protein
MSVDDSRPMPLTIEFDHETGEIRIERSTPLGTYSRTVER